MNAAETMELELIPSAVGGRLVVLVAVMLDPDGERRLFRVFGPHAELRALGTFLRRYAQPPSVALPESHSARVH